FGWSMAVYGAHATLTSNTSVSPVGNVEPNYFRKLAGNLTDTVVPYSVRTRVLPPEFEQKDGLGRLRDLVFIAYQTNLLFGIGACGGLAAILLLGAYLWR